MSSEPVQAAVENLSVPSLGRIFREVLRMMESVATGDKESVRNYVEIIFEYFKGLTLAFLRKSADLLTRFSDEK